MDHQASFSSGYRSAFLCGKGFKKIITALLKILTDFLKVFKEFGERSSLLLKSLQRLFAPLVFLREVLAS